MSYNWNVYKLFNNGNRAKAPFAVVEGEDCESESFMSKLRKNLEEKFGAKAALTKYKIMRADLPQEERADVEKEKNLVLRNRVLSTKINALGLNLQNKRTAGALVMSGDTNWKWQWAAIEKGTSNYIQGLSPTFKTHKEAETWIENLISLKV